MPSTFGIVDLFAGPGGLGEGFASLIEDGHAPFRIGISVEKEASAHRTLTLRALTSLPSVRCGWVAPSGSCISFRPPRFTTRNGTWSVTVSGTGAPRVSKDITMDVVNLPLEQNISYRKSFIARCAIERT